MIKAGTATPGLKLGTTTIARAYVGATLVLGTEPVTFSLVASSGVDTSTIAIPGSAQAGDLAVFFDFIKSNTSLPSAAVPSGWTQLQTTGYSTSNYFRCTSAYKVLASGDLNTSVGAQTGAGTVTYNKVIFIFRGTVTPTSAALDVKEQALNGNPSSETINPTTGYDPLLLFACLAGNGTANTASFATSDFDGSQAGGTANMLVGYKYRSNSTASWTFDGNQVAASTAIIQQGFYFSFDPTI